MDTLECRSGLAVPHAMIKTLRRYYLRIQLPHDTRTREHLGGNWPRMRGELHLDRIVLHPDPKGHKPQSVWAEGQGWVVYDWVNGDTELLQPGWRIAASRGQLSADGTVTVWFPEEKDRTPPTERDVPQGRTTDHAGGPDKGGEDVLVLEGKEMGSETTKVEDSTLFVTPSSSTEDRLARLERLVVGHKETQTTIMDWGDKTFDDNGTALMLATRMNVEVAELLQHLIHGNPYLERMARMNSEMAEALSSLVLKGGNWNNPMERPAHLLPITDEAKAKAAGECADNLIVLYQVASRLGVDLHDEVDKKMARNRARTWKKTEGGRYQHATEPDEIGD